MAVQLNGSSQYLQRDCTGDVLPAAGVHFTSPYTIAGWVKRSGGAGTEMGIFALHCTQTGNSPSVVVEHSPSNTLAGYLDASGSVAPGKTFSTDEWVYVAVRWDGNLKVSYALEADSALTNSSTTAGNDATAANWLTFGRWPSGLYFNGVLAHQRAWTEYMSDANLLLEKASATLVRSTNNYGAWELVADGRDSTGSRDLTVYGSPSYVSGPTLGASAVDLSGAATVGASASGVLGVKMLKLLTSSAAIGATVDGVVFAAQGGAIVGAEIGEFTGKTIVAGSGADAGKGVLLIPVTDFGGTALNEGDAPLVYLRNSTHFTPIWPGLIVPT